MRSRRSVDAETETETWWRASLPVLNPSTPYRWLLDRGESGYSWVNGRGVSPQDLPDGGDFVLTLDAGGPDWHLGSVVYEIFPDRFAATGAGADAPLPDGPCGASGTRVPRDAARTRRASCSAATCPGSSSGSTTSSSSG